ncbi:GNAT family protein [Salarchaeum sp. III]|uniref:GNAT family N-acetyltransferase n=1 Tax=Salarchaeum sp. III TaxID=3107927 RepID=UPI002EDAC7FF
MSAFLTGDTVSLDPATEDDVEFFARAWNDHRLRTPLLLAEPTTREEMRESLLDDEGARFVVRVDEGRVGACSLFRVDERHGHATVSYWIRPTHQCEGYASDALDAVCEYAFRERRLHKLRAGLVASNDASAGVLESVGFREEARLEDELFYDGAYADERRYRLLENEYR